MSEWAPPSSSDFPGQPTDGIDALLRKVERIKRELDDATNNILKAAGLSVEPGLLRVLGSLAVDNDVTIGGSGEVTGLLQSANFVPGVSGWRLTSTGLEVNTLTAKDAIIGNQALVSPLTAAIAPPAWANNWSGGGSWVTKASTSIPVPAGYTQALAFATSSVTVVGSLIRYDIRTGIAAGYGSELQNLVDGVDSSSVAHTRTLSGLSGGSLTLEAQVFTAPALAAHTGNIATVTGFAIFFR